MGPRAQQQAPPTGLPTIPGSLPSHQYSGLPEAGDTINNVYRNNNQYYRDIHMETAKGMTHVGRYADVCMATAKPFTLNNDITMETARGGGGTTVKKSGFQLWEKELLASPEIKRKATVAQLCRFEISIPTHSLFPSFFFS